jgi:diguanylate cyclase (GGDEF)-like protein
MVSIHNPWLLPKQKMKILLVDDARAISAIMEARLTSFGHEVSIAENGQVAFDMFCKSPPDLILMDIEMPVMNGFEATSRIRAYEATLRWAWTPIIFLSATDKPENLVTSIEAGGDDYLLKSLSEADLHAKMKAMSRIAEMRQLLSTANLKLEQLASRDGLTGLYNRRWMDMSVDLAWEESIRKNKPFALLMLDIDNFKKYNDYYGHLIGDDCLRTIAQSIEEVVAQANAEGLTKDAFCARYGGEEFTVVIFDASLAAYEKCARNILESVRNLEFQHEQNGEWGIVTISIGGCRCEVSFGTVSKIFRNADAALYRAKENGRNRIEFAE